MIPDPVLCALALIPSAALALAFGRARKRAQAAERETRKTKAILDSLQRANSTEIARRIRLEDLYNAEKKERNALESERDRLVRTMAGAKADPVEQPAVSGRDDGGA